MLRRLLFLVMTVVASLTGMAAADSGPKEETAGDSTESWTRVNDDDPSVTYSAHVRTFPNSGYYSGDMHHSSNTVGEWCQVTFTGTGVKWIGGKNADHGDVDVYLDGRLDATVNSAAPSWLKQQEIYTKTGLNDGPHVLKIEIKTSGYQDFDAFDFASKPLPPLPRKKLAHLLLPEQVPYLNTRSRYPLGNGVAIAIGDASGGWSQLFGPGYTSPNFISL